MLEAEVLEHSELDNAQRHFGREVKAIDSKSIALLLEQFGLSSLMVFGFEYNLSSLVVGCLLLGLCYTSILHSFVYSSAFRSTRILLSSSRKLTILVLHV